MIINGKTMMELIREYWKKTGKILSISKLDFSFLENNTDKLLSGISPDHHEETKKIINSMLQNRKKIEDAISLKDEYIRKVVLYRFEDMIKNYKVEIIENRKETSKINDIKLDLYSLSEYFPIRTIVKNNHRDFDVKYIYLQKEKIDESILFDFDMNYANKYIIDDIIRFNTKYSVEDLSFSIGNRKYLFYRPIDFFEFLIDFLKEKFEDEKMMAFDKKDINIYIIRNYLLDIIINSLPKNLKKYAKKITDDITPHVRVVTDMYKLAPLLPMEFSNMRTEIYITTEPLSYPSVNIMIRAENEKVKFNNLIFGTLFSLENHINKTLSTMQEILIKHRNEINKIFDYSNKMEFSLDTISEYLINNKELIFVLTKKNTKYYLELITIHLFDDKYVGKIMLDKNIKTNINKKYIINKLKLSSGKTKIKDGIGYISIIHLFETKKIDDIFQRYDYLNKNFGALVDDYVNKRKQKSKPTF